MTAQGRDLGDKGHAESGAAAWRRPPQDLTLPLDHVHVWRAWVAPHASALSGLRSVLSPAERERADRFHFAADQDQFVVARGLLRVLLGRYLQQPPEQICFKQNPHGKPALDPSANRADLRFNLSHSKGLVLYAVARGREVGVDVEQLRLVADFERISEQYFSLAERKELGMLRDECKLDGFFGLWTLKESYVKARGQGLSVPLDEFSVSLEPDASGSFLTHACDSRECARWSLRRLTPGPGYAGALTVEGHDWHLACWDFAGERKVGGMKDVYAVRSGA